MLLKKYLDRFLQFILLKNYKQLLYHLKNIIQFLNCLILVNI